MQQSSSGEYDKSATGRRAPAAVAGLPAPWQALLSGRSASARRSRGGTLGFFLELLPRDDAPALRLEAAPVWLSAKARGRPARAAALDPRKLTDPRLSAAEQRLAAGVLGLPSNTRRERRYACLSGRVGDALLTDMLDTAPCFLGGSAGLHLARGKAQALTWHWNRDAEGHQQLGPQLRPGQRLFVVGRLWYLDAERAELGVFHGDEDAIRLLAMPPLAPPQSAAFARALAVSSLAQRLPAPHVFAPPRSIDAAPRRVLDLHAVDRPAYRASTGSPLGYARLRFDYAGVRVSSHEEDTPRVYRGKLVDIRRRRAEELAAMEDLEACGLRPAVDTEGLPWEVAETLPEDAWLFPGKGHAGALEVNTPSRWLSLHERFAHGGFALDYAPSFPFEVVEVPAKWYASARDKCAGRHFDVELGVELEGKRVNLLPAVTRALDAGELTLEATEKEPEDPVWYAPLDTRRRLPVHVRVLRPLLAPLAEHLQRASGHVRLPRVQAGRLDELAQVLPAPEDLKAPAPLREFTTRLHKAASGRRGKLPAQLHATLRPYQRDGLHWLDALAAAGVGGILADDMGLGKTLQVLAHVLSLRDAGHLHAPVLVVAPTSLIPNWESESARFAPTLSLLTLSGPRRDERFDALTRHDLILTSYALLPRDLPALARHRYALVVLDEAQQVKNPRTHARRAVLKLKAPRRLCMTGTPLENHLGELWSQMDLAVPGLLGEEAAFRRHYRVPIEKHHDEECQQRLNRRLAPFILRRTKAQVATELPPKTEVARRVFLHGRQRALYDRLRRDLAEQLHAVIAERGIEHAGIVVLDALLKLRQVCCDPRLVKADQARGVRESAKFELLMEMLPALLADGRRVLVFSQFTEMLQLIAAALDRRHIGHVTLTGDTRDRAEPVRRFQAGEVPLFLLSLRAGGVGLNLTAADAVVHYDPWWNPAAEAQASDRAHRIGQDKPVFVYRLITVGTVEERIEAMKARKAELAEAVLAGGGTRERLKFDQDDLDALLAPA